MVNWIAKIRSEESGWKAVLAFLCSRLPPESRCCCFLHADYCSRHNPVILVHLKAFPGKPVNQFFQRFMSLDYIFTEMISLGKEGESRGFVSSHEICIHYSCWWWCCCLFHSNCFLLFMFPFSGYRNAPGKVSGFRTRASAKDASQRRVWKWRKVSQKGKSTAWNKVT